MLDAQCSFCLFAWPLMEPGVNKNHLNTALVMFPFTSYCACWTMEPPSQYIDCWALTIQTETKEGFCFYIHALNLATDLLWNFSGFRASGCWLLDLDLLSTGFFHVSSWFLGLLEGKCATAWRIETDGLLIMEVSWYLSICQSFLTEEFGVEPESANLLWYKRRADSGPLARWDFKELTWLVQVIMFYS